MELAIWCNVKEQQRAAGALNANLPSSTPCRYELQQGLSLALRGVIQRLQTVLDNNDGAEDADTVQRRRVQNREASAPV